MVTKIDDAEAIDFLERLVRIYSPSFQERPVAEYIVQAMGRWGYQQAEIDAAGNAVGFLGEGKQRILLLGHIDTVPGYIPVRREGSLLYGRGTVDAKGPFAAFVVAAARAAQRANLQIIVVGAVEEEAASSAGAYYIVNHLTPTDYVIIGEPSSWQRITISYKGRLLIDYALERPLAHTAGQQRGVCEEAVDFWLRIRNLAQSYNQDKERQSQTLDPSLRSICSSNDGLRERVEMTIGLRLPLGFEASQLTSHLAEWKQEAQVSTRGYELPFRAPKRNALTSAFLAAIRAEGAKPAFVSKTGTSDMNVIGPRWKRPIVAYGPGDSSLDHTPEEHLDLEEYLAAIRVLERVLERLGKKSSS
ncbi:MAG: [LysW]-lysine hydrolase [Anaerolineae bacterium]|nr:[LysW]-lysine hydrolase [Anaerolineae bacterium]